MTGMAKIEGRIERQARLRWVPLTQMRVNPLAQRDLNQARVSKLAAVFDPEKMDAPTVNHRGDWYYLIDGQHRIAALGLPRRSPWAGGSGISAVATLRRVYTRGGAAVLSRTLRIIRDAYGEAGLDGPVIDGIGLLCQRYNGDLSEQRAIERLSSAHGGVSGLLSRAGQLRQSTGSATAQCVAAAAVEVINRGSGGRKLPGWWRNDQ